MLKLLSVLCVVSSLMTMLNATEVIFKGLVLPNYDEKQKLTSLLKSENAVYKGRYTQLGGISLEVYDENIIKVNSPAGTYDSETGIVYGNTSIKAEDTDMKITGKKWQVNTQTSEIKIFENVNIQLTKKED